MKKYRIWITSKESVIVEAECPSKAIEKCGHRYFWRIESLNGTADRSNKKRLD